MGHVNECWMSGHSQCTTYCRGSFGFSGQNVKLTHNEFTNLHRNYAGHKFRTGDGGWDTHTHIHTTFYTAICTTSRQNETNRQNRDDFCCVSTACIFVAIVSKTRAMIVYIPYDGYIFTQSILLTLMRFETLGWWHTEHLHLNIRNVVGIYNTQHANRAPHTHTHTVDNKYFATVFRLLIIVFSYLKRMSTKQLFIRQQHSQWCEFPS